MQHENNKKSFAGKGYYIALIACIAAVGISGYVFVKTAQDSAVETSAVVSQMPDVKEEENAAPTSAVQEKKEPESTAEMGDSYEETMEAPQAEHTVMWPLEGEVAEVFSRDTLTYSKTMADWRTHEGLDILAEQGAPVHATQDGTVTAVYADDYLGTVVMVSHPGDISTCYANLTETPAVAVGDSVAAGDVLGQVGNTALLEKGEPDHLHFEVYRSGEAADPLEYLPE